MMEAIGYLMTAVSILIGAYVGYGIAYFIEYVLKLIFKC